MLGEDPLSGPLADNGGHSQTIALALGSPAIDAGNPSGSADASGDPFSLDQRGEARPYPAGGRCDIGAYEAMGCSVVGTLSTGVASMVLFVAEHPDLPWSGIFFSAPDGIFELRNPHISTCSSFGAPQVTVAGTVGWWAHGAFKRGDGIAVEISLANRDTVQDVVVTDFTAGITYRLQAPFGRRSHLSVRTP